MQETQKPSKDPAEIIMWLPSKKMKDFSGLFLKQRKQEYICIAARKRKRCGDPEVKITFFLNSKCLKAQLSLYHSRDFKFL